MRQRQVFPLIAAIAATGLCDEYASCGSQGRDFAPIRGHLVRPPNLVRGNRNSPCPCGSGKKFKKCCIGTAKKTDKE